MLVDAQGQWEGSDRPCKLTLTTLILFHSLTTGENGDGVWVVSVLGGGSPDGMFAWQKDREKERHIFTIMPKKSILTSLSQPHLNGADKKKPRFQVSVSKSRSKNNHQPGQAQQQHQKLCIPPRCLAPVAKSRPAAKFAIPFHLHWSAWGSPGPTSGMTATTHTPSHPHTQTYKWHTHRQNTNLHLHLHLACSLLEPFCTAHLVPSIRLIHQHQITNQERVKSIFAICNTMYVWRSHRQMRGRLRCVLCRS